MINLIIVGTGAVAAEQTANIEMNDYFHEGGKVQIKGYLEYDEYSYLHAQYDFKYPLLGNVDSYKILEDDYFIIGNGHNALRQEFAGKLLKRGAKFINLIHPTSLVAPTAKIGIGNIISPFCMIGPNAVVGDFNILTSYSCISHDCIVDSFNFFSSTVVCGHVHIGNRNNFNVRTSVIPHISIGDDCVIQAGMTIDKSVESGATVFYRYKEKILAIPK